MRQSTRRLEDRRPCRAGRAALLLTTALVLAAAPAAAMMEDDLAEMDLESLMNLEVTSVSKKAEKLSAAPAAVYVLTHDDIQRSGVRTIPEALRMVPGLHVARMNGNRWAISSRGFNSLFADKLLVLIDGRSVYTPLFAGVYWDIQDVLLEDVDRIEVIRGPGGTLWGANAVNGVINIVTKRAEDTQGGYVEAGGGEPESRFAGARYGGEIGDMGHYRVWGKYFDRDEFEPVDALEPNDATRQGRGGFRVDLDLTEADSLTVQGDAYVGSSEDLILSTANDPTLATNAVKSDGDVRGGNLLMRAQHRFSEDSEAQLQFYWDHHERNDDPTFDYVRDTVDLELQHRFQLLDFTEVVWGGGYRNTRDEQVSGSLDVSLTDDERMYELWSAFGQAETRLLDDRLRIVLGSKVEYNDFTGFEYQPTGRLAWVQDLFTVWGAVSRAVRSPARINDDVEVLISTVPSPPAPAPTAALADGRTSFESEDLLAYELGFRLRPHERVFVDVAGYYNDYENLGTIDETTEPPFCSNTRTPVVTPGDIATCLGGGGFLKQAVAFDNEAKAQAYGVEVATRYQALDWWSLNANYTWMTQDIDTAAGSTSALAETGNEPDHQFHLRSHMDLPYDTSFDTALFFVDDLSNIDVPEYVRVDFRVAWRPIEQVELEAVVQNAFDHAHREFNNTLGFTATRIPRSFYGAVSWKF